MNFDIIKGNPDLRLIYSPRDGSEWIDDFFERDQELCLKYTFYFKKEHCVDLNSANTVSRTFVIGKLRPNGYYEINKNIFQLKNDFYISSDIEIYGEMFLTEIGNIPVLYKIDQLVDDSVYIGGDNENAVPIGDFKMLLNEFPTRTELKHYASSRIENILKEYLKFKTDSQAKLNRYILKRLHHAVPAELSTITEFEIQKYEFIRDRLKEMLKDPDIYPEKEWEQKILDFILILYPKYIQVLHSVPVYDFYTSPGRTIKREIDVVLLDANGNMDIIEIKKPLANCVLSTNSSYRDNYIPRRDLSGAVVQAEKYIFHLCKWGIDGENLLNRKYKNDLLSNLKIKIVNPKAILILGRSNTFDDRQKFDFEIIRRKYANIMDILTYDELLERLDHIIEKFNVKMHDDKK